jgi:hypothetical protein
VTAASVRHRCLTLAAVIAFAATAEENRRGAAARPDADGRTSATTSQAVPERGVVLQWPRRAAPRT